MKLFRTGSIDVVQECRSYFGVELPYSCLIKKNKISFCLGITVWRICFVDIVVYVVIFCAAVQRNDFVLYCIIFVCQPLLMVNKVDQNKYIIKTCMMYRQNANTEDYLKETY